MQVPHLRNGCSAGSSWDPGSPSGAAAWPCVRVRGAHTRVCRRAPVCVLPGFGVYLPPRVWALFVLSQVILQGDLASQKLRRVARGGRTVPSTCARLLPTLGSGPVPIEACWLPLPRPGHPVWRLLCGLPVRALVLRDWGLGRGRRRAGACSIRGGCVGTRPGWDSSEVTLSGSPRGAAPAERPLQGGQGHIPRWPLSVWCDFR